MAPFSNSQGARIGGSHQNSLKPAPVGYYGLASCMIVCAEPDRWRRFGI